MAQTLRCPAEDVSPFGPPIRTGPKRRRCENQRPGGEKQRLETDMAWNQDFETD